MPAAGGGGVREQRDQARHPPETLVPGLAVLEPREYGTAVAEQPRRQRVGAKLPTVRRPSAATQHGARSAPCLPTRSQATQRIGAGKPGGDHAGEPRDQANGPELGGEQRQRESRHFGLSTCAYSCATRRAALRRPAGRDPAPDRKPRRAPRSRRVRVLTGRSVNVTTGSGRSPTICLSSAITTASSSRSSRPALGASTPEILALPPDGQIGLEPPFQTGFARERPLRHRAIRHGN